MHSNKPVFILALVFILSAISLISLIIFTSNYPNSTYHTSQIVSNECNNDALPEEINNQYPKTPTEDILSPKEYQLISNLISNRAPCNLLIFGSKTQLLSLAEQNTEGTTVFLEDDIDRYRLIKMQEGVRMYLFTGHEQASKAYELLKYARNQSVCRFHAGSLRKCMLALKDLPKIVYQKKWDIVIIDGPSGDRLEAPGRMGAIYTAAVIARAGENTEVLVHDTDRTIEKWYSWEFLCQENLASMKSKLWHFRIKGSSKYGRFCPRDRHQIL